MTMPGRTVRPLLEFALPASRLHGIQRGFDAQVTPALFLRPLLHKFWNAGLMSSDLQSVIHRL